MGRVEHIEIIRTICDKTRAEVEFKAETYDEEKIEETWCLPFMDQLLVRITPGTNNQNLLYKRSKYSLRLLDLPENTNEVLLWRQAKKTGAKALHIFKNSNNNKMGSATVYFNEEKDRVSSLKFSIYYYNNKLRWSEIRKQEVELTNKTKIEEQVIVQRRSEKSLGKRREFEQEQEGECSKYVKVESNNNREDVNRETKSTIAENIQRREWKPYSMNRVNMSEKEGDSSEWLKKNQSKKEK